MEKKYNLYARDASEENVSFKLFAELTEEEIQDEDLTKRFSWCAEKLAAIVEVLDLDADLMLETLNSMEYLIIEKKTGVIIRQFKHTVAKREEN